MEYTWIDFAFLVAVAFVGGSILLVFQHLARRLSKWLRMIRDLSNEVIESRERIKELEEKIKELRK